MASSSGHSPSTSLFKSIEVDTIDKDAEAVDLFPEETEILSSFVSRQAKYGSTSSHRSYDPTSSLNKFIIHKVEPNDTLQGEFLWP